jgi:hypothetical protein
VTRSDIGDREILLAADIEARLREAGVPSLLIPGIIGAAFIASLTNLPAAARARTIEAHLSALDEVTADVLRAGQAPDGPMPGLRNVGASRQQRRRQQRH